MAETRDVLSAFLMFERFAKALKVAVRDEGFLPILGAALLLVIVGTLTYTRPRIGVWRTLLLRRRNANDIEHRRPHLVIEDGAIKIFTVFYILVGIGILVELARQIGFAFVEVRREEKRRKPPRPTQSSRYVTRQAPRYFRAASCVRIDHAGPFAAGDVWSGCMDAQPALPAEERELGERRPHDQPDRDGERPVALVEDAREVLAVKAGDQCRHGTSDATTVSFLTISLWVSAIFDWRKSRTLDRRSRATLLDHAHERVVRVGERPLRRKERIVV